MVGDRRTSEKYRGTVERTGVQPRNARQAAGGLRRAICWMKNSSRCFQRTCPDVPSVYLFGHGDGIAELKDNVWRELNSESNKLQAITDQSRIVHKNKDLNFLQNELKAMGEDEDIQFVDEEEIEDLMILNTKRIGTTNLKNSSENAWTGIADIRFGTGCLCFQYGRRGGYSEGAYASFNANAYCGDDERMVRLNRDLLCESLGLETSCLIIPHQVHGARASYR